MLWYSFIRRPENDTHVLIIFATRGGTTTHGKSCDRGSGTHSHRKARRMALGSARRRIAGSCSTRTTRSCGTRSDARRTSHRGVRHSSRRTVQQRDADCMAACRSSLADRMYHHRLPMRLGPTVDPSDRRSDCHRCARRRNRLWRRSDEPSSPRCQCRCARRTSSTCLLEHRHARSIRGRRTHRPPPQPDADRHRSLRRALAGESAPRVGGAPFRHRSAARHSAGALIGLGTYLHAGRERSGVCERPLRRHLLRSPRSLPAEYTPPEPRRRFPTAQLRSC